MKSRARNIITQFQIMWLIINKITIVSIFVTLVFSTKQFTESTTHKFHCSLSDKSDIIVKKNTHQIIIIIPQVIISENNLI